MDDATLVVHAGHSSPAQGEPFRAGPTFAAPYRHLGQPDGSANAYARMGNPTWTAYESALAELEGGPCLVFASGMAAVAAVLGTTLRPGDLAVLPADGYYTARSLAGGYLTEMGVRIVTTPTAGSEHRELLDGARLLWLETPSNPGLDVCDIRPLARAAHDAGALVAVDNSTATMLGQRPLGLGADFCVSSDTKAVTGHSDLVLGHVAVSDPGLLAALATWRAQVGAIAGPMETWLAHRSLATLDVRLRRQCETALQIAIALRDHRCVASVRYPGLPGDPAHELASRQMRFFGPLVCFTLADEDTAERWLRALRLVTPATSFGGAHTTAERRARWEDDDVAGGFIRLSAGLENAGDVIDDITSAFEA
ncbi:MAG: cystathionine gamma-lyase [Mycobacteriales bacterium]|nr:MAG: cystathionine gamma-lyase [Pseudonocardiales bacterium]